MKATLIKRGTDNYKLYVNEVPFATTDNSPYKRLSKQNCDEIFGIFDAKKYAEKVCDDTISSPYHCYVAGFNKAMELNKDKLYTAEDVYYMFQLGFSLNGKAISKLEYETHLESLQQPTEMEVEILYIRDCQAKTPCNEYENKCLICTPTYPKLDSEGCLILKKYGK